MVYDGYYFFEFPVGKVAHFSLRVLHAKNKEATRQNVYWICQWHKDFGTKYFLGFDGVVNSKPLHEHLNSLNEGTKYGAKLLSNGQPNKNYDPQYSHQYTLASTGYVDYDYLDANPRNGNTNSSIHSDDDIGGFAFHADERGKGIWMEG